MPTYSLTLEYDGTDFAGWQIQPRVAHRDGRPPRRARTVTGETPALTAAGRTDAGAHAHGQVAGCTLERDWAPRRAAPCAQRRAACRPRGSRRRTCSPQTFNARRDAVERTYRYLIVCRDGRAR